jgi:hypothetical protein
MAYRIGLDVKWYNSKVGPSVVRSEIEEAHDNDCDTLVLVCKKGWTSGAEKVADEADIDVILTYPPDDMRDLKNY